MELRDTGSRLTGAHVVVDMLPTRHVRVLSSQAVRQIVWAQLTVLGPWLLPLFADASHGSGGKHCTAGQAEA